MRRNIVYASFKADLVWERALSDWKCFYFILIVLVNYCKVRRAKPRRLKEKNMYKNFKLRTVALSVAGCLMAAGLPMAFAGSEGSGGGESLERHLRDFIDNGTCIVEMGDEFAEREAPMVATILSSLEKTQWIFADLIRHEIGRLRICMIRGELPRINTNDLDSMTHVKNPGNGRLTAIRLLDEPTVFVSKREFKGPQGLKDPIDRAGLIIHEAMHSFLDQGVSRRNDKLRNIVHAIGENFKAPMSPKKFALQMEFSEIQCVRAPSEYGDFQDVMTILSSNATAESKIQAQRKIIQFNRKEARLSGFWELTYDGCIDLRLGDRSLNENLQAAQKDIDQRAQTALESGDAESFKKLLPLSTFVVGPNELAVALDRGHLALAHALVAEMPAGSRMNQWEEDAPAYAGCADAVLKRSIFAKVILSGDTALWDELIEKVGVDSVSHTPGNGFPYSVSSVAAFESPIVTAYALEEASKSTQGVAKLGCTYAFWKSGSIEESRGDISWLWVTLKQIKERSDNLSSCDFGYYTGVYFVPNAGIVCRRGARSLMVAKGISALAFAKMMGMTAMAAHLSKK